MELKKISVNNTVNRITVSEMVNKLYRSFWNYTNKGKNAFLPEEQMFEVVKRIVYSAYKIKIKPYDEVKVPELSGEVVKIHPHSPDSINDSIQGLTSKHKSQVATRLFEGIGNFGGLGGIPAAAARYVFIGGTPLLSHIYKDMPFFDFEETEDGTTEPKSIVMPIPYTLATGSAPIGTGKSAYYCERLASDIIDWIEAMHKNNNWEPTTNEISRIETIYDYKNDGIYETGYKNWLKESYEEGACVPIPPAVSLTGCKTWKNPDNGYTYYEAVIHYSVDLKDLSKRGGYDIITELPPGVTMASVEAKLRELLPTRIASSIKNGSGEGNPVWIAIPKGWLEEKDFNKLNLRKARIEAPYIWDSELKTMRMSNHWEIAKMWFDARCEIVTRRLMSQIEKLEAANYRIDIIKEYFDQKMFDSSWTEEKICEYFKGLAVKNKISRVVDGVEMTSEEAGIADGHLLCGLPARTFYKENIEKNKEIREANVEEIEELQKDIENIGEFIIAEARNIIGEQIKFFNS